MQTIRIIPASALTIIPIGNITAGGSLIFLNGMWRHFPVQASSVAAVVVKDKR